MRPEPVGPDEESVWDYPRPPRLERDERRVVVTFNGHVVADTAGAWKVLETSHPPTWYLPPDDIDFDVLERAPGGSYCEWKGQAHYYTVRVGDAVAEKVGWGYADPTPDFRAITDHVAFYAGPMDSVTVDGVEVEPQPGGFYGGWITAEVKGPFKGGPGSWGW